MTCGCRNLGARSQTGPHRHERSPGAAPTARLPKKSSPTTLIYWQMNDEPRILHVTLLLGANVIGHIASIIRSEERRENSHARAVTGRQKLMWRREGGSVGKLFGAELQSGQGVQPPQTVLSHSHPRQASAQPLCQWSDFVRSRA